MQAPLSSSSDEDSKESEEEEHIVRIKQELRNAGTLWETYPSNNNKRERTKELRSEKKGKVVARGHKKRMKRSQVFEDRDESAREGSSVLERTIRVKRKLELEDNGVDDDEEDDDGDNSDLPKLFEHPCEAC